MGISLLKYLTYQRTSCCKWRSRRRTCRGSTPCTPWRPGRCRHDSRRQFQLPSCFWVGFAVLQKCLCFVLWFSCEIYCCDWSGPQLASDEYGERADREFSNIKLPQIWRQIDFRTWFQNNLLCENGWYAFEKYFKQIWSNGSHWFQSYNFWIVVCNSRNEGSINGQSQHRDGL